MKITLVIEDTADDAVRIEKTDQPGTGETDQSVTPASVLAEELLRFAESFGEGAEAQAAVEPGTTSTPKPNAYDRTVIT